MARPGSATLLADVMPDCAGGGGIARRLGARKTDDEALEHQMIFETETDFVKPVYIVERMGFQGEKMRHRYCILPPVT